MKLHLSVPVLLVLVANLGCSQGRVPQRETPAVVPPSVVSPLTALVGEYRLLAVDGEAAEDGRLSVIEAEDGVGVVYAATLSGVASQRHVLTPLQRTTLVRENDRVHQQFQEGENKTTLDYDRVGSEITVEIIECTPGKCLSTVLSGAK